MSFVLVRNQIWPTVSEPSRSVTVTDASSLPNTAANLLATVWRKPSRIGGCLFAVLNGGRHSSKLAKIENTASCEANGRMSGRRCGCFLVTPFVQQSARHQPGFPSLSQKMDFHSDFVAAVCTVHIHTHSYAFRNSAKFIGHTRLAFV